MKNKNKTGIYFLLTLIIGILIFYLSITPQIEKGGVTINSGIIKHLIAYFLLSFFIYKTTNKKSLSFILTGTYGLLIEAVQFTIPYRAFEILDIIVNYLGASIIFIIPKHKK